MSQSPAKQTEFEHDSKYADSARQLNKLVRAGKSYSGHERNCCYLNLEGKRFVSAAMVSGFDYPEDGRAIAICDWDADGDQDFWVANRTAPQLRLMRNDLANQAGTHHVAFRLEGTSCNRDGIGARIFLRLDSPSPTQLTKTLRAGEGFLACGSKTIHFGLGEATNIRSVEVRWPNGGTESFSGVDSVDQLYLLKQGSGQATAISRSRELIQPAESLMPEQGIATHNWLTEPAPCPPLLYIDTDSQTVDAVVGGAPTILNLWASWCEPCLEELAEWSTSHDEFRERNVRLLALCTDGISETPRSMSQSFLAKLNFQGETGDATPQLIDALQHLHNVVYDHHRTLPVPTTILLDKAGNMRALYKGRVATSRLLADIARLDSDDTSLPFQGKWLGQQGSHNMSLLVEELFRDDYGREATAFVERLDTPRLQQHQIKARLFLAQEQSVTDKVESLRQLLEVLKLEPKNPSAHEHLGLLMARSGRIKEALHHLEQAVVNSPEPSARSRFNYARSLRQNGFIEPAIEQFNHTINLDAEFTPAFEQLGLIRASQQQYEQAALDFGRASSLEPDVPRHRINLAMALNELGRYQDAWQEVKSITSSDNPPKLALLTAARSLAAMGQTQEAIVLLERFLLQEPDAEGVRRQLQALQEQARAL